MDTTMALGGQVAYPMTPTMGMFSHPAPAVDMQQLLTPDFDFGTYLEISATESDNHTRLEYTPDALEALMALDPWTPPPEVAQALPMALPRPKAERQRKSPVQGNARVQKRTQSQQMAPVQFVAQAEQAATQHSARRRGRPGRDPVKHAREERRRRLSQKELFERLEEELPPYKHRGKPTRESTLERAIAEIERMRMVIAELEGDDYDNTPQTVEESVPESLADIEGMGFFDDELFTTFT